MRVWYEVLFGVRILIGRGVSRQSIPSEGVDNLLFNPTEWWVKAQAWNGRAKQRGKTPNAEEADGTRANGAIETLYTCGHEPSNADVSQSMRLRARRDVLPRF